MMENVVNSGTGQSAQIDRPVAGKTGTSEKARDLWFIGFIPQLATGVWLGNDDNSPTWSASSTAASVWHDFMTTAVRGMPVKSFQDLPNLDTRKGSIKAKPINPGRVVNGEASRSESSSSSGNYYPEEHRSNSAPAEPARQSESRSSEPSNSTPAPAQRSESSEAPPAAPEPAAPPPDNVAPPELPPAEPAAPPVTSGQPQSAPSK